MFSPQRQKTPWTPSHKPDSKSTSSTLQTASSKGKTVSFYDAPPLPPPMSSLQSNGGGNFEDWKRFKEVGLLDKSALEKKDHQALLEKISRLEKELFDYQYNMGLLLIEKKDLVSTTEELGQEVVVAEEILKRERVMHVIAVSEAEKREENLKKAINAERLSVLDLERAMRYMHEEHAIAKSTCETSVADLNARMEELHKQNLEVVERSRSVDLNLEELDKKNYELDRKLQDLDLRENNLQREHLLLTQERQSHELNFQKQKDDILKWEKELQKGEQSLCDSRRLLNEREEKLLEIETSSKIKESNMEELQKKIDLANATSKKIKDDVKSQLIDLDMKEKNVEAMRRKLEGREKQLLEEEERIDVRERVELEKILDEHKVMLNAKMHEFELDLKHKRTDLEEELRSRKEAVDQKETKINHLEVKLGKREQALDKKAERVNEKEKDFEAKNKTQKEQERFLKSEEKRLEAEKKQVNADKESLETIRKEIEMLRNNTKEQELHIEEEWKTLKVAEKERLEYLHLQSSLKQEIDSVRSQSELIKKEAGDLKLERELFEKDWEALDEKQSVVENEQKALAENKTMLEKLRNSEEERLKLERAEFEERLHLESKNIRLRKESFETTMESEKLKLDEEAKIKFAHMRDEFERQKEDLYNDMQKKDEEWGILVEERERALAEIQSREMKNLKQLKECAEKKRDEMEIERHHLEKDRKAMELNKKQLEEARVGFFKDIEVLDNLSKNLKKQREQLVNEREHFIELIDKIKCCQNCGDSAQEFLHSDIQLPTVEGTSCFPRLSLDDQSEPKDELGFFRDFKKSKFVLPEIDRELPPLGGQMSVLRKCASVFFNLSPKKGVQNTDNHLMEESPHSASHTEVNEHSREQTAFVEEAYVNAQPSSVDEPEPVIDVVNDGNKIPSLDVGKDNIDNSLAVEDFITDSEVQGAKESKKSDVETGQRKSGRKRGPGVRRTHSVKEVVQEAKAFLKDDSLGKLEEQPSDSADPNVNNQEKSLDSEMMHGTSASKRSHSKVSKVTENEQDAEYSEGNADSVTTGGRRKRQQTVASVLPTPGQKRYNLRRHSVATSSDKPKPKNKVTDKDTNQAIQNPDKTPSQSLDSKILHLGQVSTTRIVEFSSEKCNVAHVADSHGDAAKSEENKYIGEVKTTEGVALMSEINETSENAEEDTRSMVNENEEDESGNTDEDYDKNDEDDDHQGQASIGKRIGKKLWNFLST